MKAYCFVAQPFDRGMFDDRFQNIIKPAVESCGLDCYRVDRDSSVDIPVKSMEERIANAALFIAEITTDNPNVWYELGYASALNKSIIMVCSDERQTPYPFDVRHKSILLYRTKGPTDYEKYKLDLKELIHGRYHKEPDTLEARRLTDEEMILLRFIARDQKDVHQITPEEKILKSHMNKDTAHDCLRSLLRGGYVEYVYPTDGRATYIRVTDLAEKILSRR